MSKNLRVLSEGDTLEEARENLRDAVELLLEANRDLAGKRISGKKIHSGEDYSLRRVGVDNFLFSITSVAVLSTRAEQKD
jgi:hypothetical protein